MFVSSLISRYLVFDEIVPKVDEAPFRTCDWTEFHKDAEEIIPAITLEAKESPVSMFSCVHADHASCKQTERNDHTPEELYI